MQCSFFVVRYKYNRNYVTQSMKLRLVVQNNDVPNIVEEFRVVRLPQQLALDDGMLTKPE